MPDRVRQIRARTGLVLQGGGARGAYQIGALKAIAELTAPERAPFPIICGTSVGAINAAPLAASAQNVRRGVARLETVWRGLHCSSIYDTRMRAIMATSAHWLFTLALGGLGVGNPCALLDNAPLGHLLNREYGRDGLRRAIDSGALRALCITASSYGGGQAISFFEGAPDIEEWDRARRHGRRTEIGVPHLMASSALPFMFPAVRIDDEYYGDGALRLTAPFSTAIRVGADRLLVIGARDSLDPVEGPGGAPEYPSIGEMAGHALDILFNDNLDADLERLNRVNRTLALLPEDARQETDLRVIDTLMLEPSRDLRDIAAEHMQEMPTTIRLLLRSLGSWGSNGRLISYLLFEPGYIGALIDLAYEDTMRRADEVRAFFDRPGCEDTAERGV